MTNASTVKIQLRVDNLQHLHPASISLQEIKLSSRLKIYINDSNAFLSGNVSQTI